MKRRDFINQSATFGIVVASGSLPNVLASNFLPTAAKLTPPAKGKIPVAVAISDGVTVIDFAGPWEVFQDVHIRERGKDMDEQMPFQLFTVSDKTEPLTGSGGLKLVPDYTFDTAPQPKVVVVPRAERIAGAARVAAQNVHLGRRDNVRLHRRLPTRQGWSS